jgi:hypothetical protein
MSEEVADLRRQLSRMTSQVQRLEAASRQNWVFAPTGSGVPTPSYLWTVLGGNVIAQLGSVGISHRTTALSASELPDGVAGSGLIIVPAWPIPVGLPDGFGVVGRYVPGNSTPVEYAFLDNSTTSFSIYTSRDLRAGMTIFTGPPRNYDKVSGAVTYRYVALTGITGIW